MNDRILVVNAGSSSLKFQVHEILPTQQLALIMGGQVSGIGGSRPAFKVKNQAGELLLDTVLTPAQAADLATAQQIMAAWLQDRMPAPPLAVGHRIVHGGREMSRRPTTPDPAGSCQRPRHCCTLGLWRFGLCAGGRRQP